MNKKKLLMGLYQGYLSICLGQRGIERWTGMNALFGACIGAIIYRLVKHEEYLHVALAIIAFAIYCYDSFDIIYLHDESSNIIFSVSIDKE